MAARLRQSYSRRCFSTSNLGPPTRAGDFAEILLSDYLEWKLGFWVPRERWNSKPTRDESVKGCDVIGFKIFDPKKASPKDVLAILESKAGLSKASNRLQDAVNDSAKDHLRIDESLNFLRQRLLEQAMAEEADRVERFQNPVDLPYKESAAAAALISTDHYDAKMYEYGVPPEDHIKIVRNPAQLFTLAIGLLGDISAAPSAIDDTQGRCSAWRGLNSGRGWRRWHQSDTPRNALADSRQCRIDGVGIDRIDDRAARVPDDPRDVERRFTARAPG